ncbi:MAG: hypothetical protein IMZ53_06420 [Thermoplasmata archaeon]|nr:hypothetical protein [Thermoplasmata archaeon]MBE3140199.1 hypothetical protein [Thermoplasmata archaeon]
MKNGEENIETLEKRHPEEWLLVEVTHADSLGNPKKGRLINHSKSKEKIIEESKGKTGDIALYYSGKIPKKGYAFCF